MRRWYRGYPGAALALVALALAGGPAFAETTTFEITMTGSPSGDPDGHAQGTLTIDSAAGMVSWEFSYSDIDTPTAMHIHAGAAGASGGVVVPLNVESSGPGRLAGSVNAEADTLSAILAAPDEYYVNIHNAEFRPGAIRGQLAD